MTDTERFLAWAAEVSQYLAEKLPQLNELHGHYRYDENGNCSCLIYFVTPPSTFVEAVVLPGLQSIHEQYTEESSRIEVRIPHGGTAYRCYTLIWEHLPRRVADAAAQYCPKEGPYDAAHWGWPRTSLTGHWLCGDHPFQSSRQWHQLEV